MVSELQIQVLLQDFQFQIQARFSIQEWSV